MKEIYALCADICHVCEGETRVTKWYIVSIGRGLRSMAQAFQAGCFIELHQVPEV